MIFLRRVSNRSQLFKKTLLALAVFGLAFPPVSTAQQVSNTSAASTSRRSATATSTTATSTTATSTAATRTVLEEGTYLFGQSPEPDQLGAAYAILSVQNNQTVGAFYQPSSSFDCFSGEVSPNRLAVNVVDSYEQTVHPYTVALTLEDSLVAGEAAGAYTLEGFHPIEDISTNDYEMLAVCQAALAQ